MSTTEVSPDGLRNSAGRLVEVVERTDALLGTFQRRLDSVGAPWGNDELGAAIADVYQSAHAMVMNCYSSNLDTIDDYAERLDAAAFLFEEADAESRAQASALLDSQGWTGP
ncbi:WXG100 family type VII secretion target [Plantactinospora sp. WMMB782]|uniref:WXG100 family type VII secretion target n=1 Tax=Plantactinospora sp. WMMB782 TaxID=3404121 RepID=UPI003B950085